MKYALYLSLIFICYSSLVLALEKSVSVITYNAENFFDEKKDIKNFDAKYLPKNFIGKSLFCFLESYKSRARDCFDFDWNTARLEEKTRNIVSILKLKGDVDIIFLQEIESELVVDRILKFMPDYNAVLAQKADKVGHRNVVLIKKHISILKKEELKTFSRGILKLFIMLGEKRVVLYAVHLPSQLNSFKKRSKEIDLLLHDILIYQKKDFGVIVAGDFNLSSSKKDLEITTKINRLKLSFLPPLFLGSYFYKKKGRWEMFDRIYVNRFFTHIQSQVLMTSSAQERYCILNYCQQIPLSSVSAMKRGYAGFSDHFAVYSKLIFIGKLNR